jgi:hypothetical protein
LWASTNTLLRVYHYSGTKNNFFSAMILAFKCQTITTPALGIRNLAAKGGKPAVDLRGWLPGFIDFVGKQEGLIFF